MLNVVQGKALAVFLRKRGLDGGRVVRLLVGAAEPRFGDYMLLQDASFTASGNYACKVTGIEELYEELQACSLWAARMTDDLTGDGRRNSDDIVNLP